MTCKEVHRILTEELHLAESAGVQKHFKTCRRCRDLQRDLLSLQELSGKLRGRTTAPRFFTERVCSQVSGRSRAAYWSLAATAAGLALLAIGILNLSGLSAESDTSAAPHGMNGGEQVQRIDHQDQVAASLEAQSDMYSLGGEESLSQETDRSSFGSQERVPRLIPKTSSSGYVLELPATIEVRQTQADAEFYLENVSH